MIGIEGAKRRANDFFTSLFSPPISMNVNSFGTVQCCNVIFPTPKRGQGLSLTTPRGVQMPDSAVLIALRNSSSVKGLLRKKVPGGKSPTHFMPFSV